jgi:hypothetical protein
MGSGSTARHILSLDTRSRTVVSFSPRPLYLQGKSLCAHWVGGWVGPRAGLDASVKRKCLTLCRESNPGRPAPSLVTILTELPRLPLLKINRIEIMKLVIMTLLQIYFPVDHCSVSLRPWYCIVIALGQLTKQRWV